MSQTTTRTFPAPGMQGDTRNFFVRTERNLEGGPIADGDLLERFNNGTYSGVRKLTAPANFYSVCKNRTAPNTPINSDEDVPACHRGETYVTTSVAVIAGDPVYITPALAITNVDGGGANTLIEGVTFINDGEADEKVLIDIQGDAR